MKITRKGWLLSALGAFAAPKVFATKSVPEAKASIDIRLRGKRHWSVSWSSGVTLADAEWRTSLNGTYLLTTEDQIVYISVHERGDVETK